MVVEAASDAAATGVVVQEARPGQVGVVERAAHGELVASVLVYLSGFVRARLQSRLPRADLLAERKGQTSGDCTTCMGMYGNGCRMNGMIHMTALQLMAVPGKMELALPRCTVVVAGTMKPGTAGLPAVASSTQAAPPATLAFVFFRKCNPFLLYHL